MSCHLSVTLVVYKSIQFIGATGLQHLLLVWQQPLPCLGSCHPSLGSLTVRLEMPCLLVYDFVTSAHCCHMKRVYTTLLHTTWQYIKPCTSDMHVGLHAVWHCIMHLHISISPTIQTPFLALLRLVYSHHDALVITSYGSIIIAWQRFYSDVFSRG